MNYIEINKEYFKESYNYAPTGLTRTEKRVFKDINPEIYPDVLDLGCGTGRTSIELSIRGFNVIGIDYVESFVYYANKRKDNKGVRFVCGDVRDITKIFPYSKFNIIFFSFNGIDYLESLQEKEVLLKELYRMLKGNGILIYQSHNSEYLFQKNWIKVNKHKFKEKNIMGRWLYTLFEPSRTQMKRLRILGFKNVKCVSAYPLIGKLLGFKLDYALIFTAKKK